MATSRSRGSAGSRSGRARPVDDDYYNDESPDVILPSVPPRGARAGAGAGPVAGPVHRPGDRPSPAVLARWHVWRRAQRRRRRRLGPRRRFQDLDRPIGRPQDRDQGRDASGRGGCGSAGGRGGPADRVGAARPGPRRKSARRPGPAGATGQAAAARSAAAKKGAATRRSAAKPAPTKDPVVILARWFYRAVCSVWLLIAWAVGSTVRRFGRNARELEADHRRDGIGLFFLGLAIVFAASIWARMDNLAARYLHAHQCGRGRGVVRHPDPVRPGRLAVLPSPGPQFGPAAGRDRLDRAARRRARAVQHHPGGAHPGAP